MKLQVILKFLRVYLNSIAVRKRSITSGASKFWFILRVFLLYNNTIHPIMCNLGGSGHPKDTYAALQEAFYLFGIFSSIFNFHRFVENIILEFPFLYLSICAASDMKIKSSFHLNFFSMSYHLFWVHHLIIYAAVFTV